jgi:hypothetical protein
MGEGGKESGNAIASCQDKTTQMRGFPDTPQRAFPMRLTRFPDHRIVRFDENTTSLKYFIPGGLNI